MPTIRARGITLIGVTLSNLHRDGAIQLALPFDRPLAHVIDATLDEVRQRFGSKAITRAVLLGRDHGPSVPVLLGRDHGPSVPLLLGRDHGPSVPLLPDRGRPGEAAARRRPRSASER